MASSRGCTSPRATSSSAPSSRARGAGTAPGPRGSKRSGRTSTACGRRRSRGSRRPPSARTRRGGPMPSATEPLRHEVRIAAPPEVVFPYFTDPARIVGWMGVAALLDPRPGGTLRIEANGRDVVLGEYVEVDPPRRVVFTWGFDGAAPLVPAGSTRVEITLEPDGAGTLLTLRHHGLAG